MLKLLENIFDRFNKNSYPISNLYVICVGNVVSYNENRSPQYGNSSYMIAQYIEDKQAIYKKYKEIFTGVIASEIEFPYQPGKIYILRISAITNYCTDDELLRGKINKERLVEIYRNINKENGKRLSRKER